MKIYQIIMIYIFNLCSLINNLDIKTHDLENNSFEIIEIIENTTIIIDTLEKDKIIQKEIHIINNNNYSVILYLSGASDIQKIYNGSITSNPEYLKTNIYVFNSEDLKIINNIFTLEYSSDKSLNTIKIYILLVNKLNNIEIINTPNNYNIDLSNFPKNKYIYTSIYENNDYNNITYAIFFNKYYGYCNIKYYNPLSIEDDLLDSSKYSELNLIENLLIYQSDNVGNLFNIQCEMPSYLSISYSLLSDSLTLNGNNGHIIYLTNASQTTISYNDYNNGQYYFNLMGFNKASLEITLISNKTKNYTLEDMNKVHTINSICSESYPCYLKIISNISTIIQIIRNYNSYNIEKIETSSSNINYQYIYISISNSDYYKMTVDMNNINNDFRYQLFYQFKESYLKMYNIPFKQDNNYINYKNLINNNYKFHFINPYDLNINDDYNFILSIEFIDSNKINIINDYSISFTYTEKPINDYTIKQNEIKQLDSNKKEIELINENNTSKYIIFSVCKCSNAYGLKFSYYDNELFTKIFDTKKKINAFIIDRNKVPKTMQIQPLYELEENSTMSIGYTIGYSYSDDDNFDINTIENFNKKDQEGSFIIDKKSKIIKVGWRRILNIQDYRIYVTKDFQANDCFFISENKDQIFYSNVTTKLYDSFKYSENGTYYIYVYAYSNKTSPFRYNFIFKKISIEPDANFKQTGVIICLVLAGVIAIIIFTIVGRYIYKRLKPNKKFNPLEYSEGTSLAEHNFKEETGDLGLNSM